MCVGIDYARGLGVWEKVRCLRVLNNEWRPTGLSVMLPHNIYCMWALPPQIPGDHVIIYASIIDYSYIIHLLES